MAETVPYINGMQRGQGYNTFLQQVCIKEAVEVTVEDPPSNPITRTYTSELIEDYEKLTKTLNISAGAAITGWGQSAQIDVGYLERSEFETSTLTYQVKVDVQAQGSTNNKFSFNDIATSTPNQTYGNRYIQDFVRGGYFFARVSISSTSKAYEQEVITSAKVAFSMYGATGEVSNEVKNAVSSLQKHSEVRIVIHESTGASKGTAGRTEDESSDLLAIKARADKFYDDAGAGKHNYIRFAFLGRYTNLSNFNDKFMPFDYTEADKRSWELFDDFTKYLAIETLIKKVPTAKYEGGQSKRSQLETEAIDQSQTIREKVVKISGDPNESRIPSTHLQPEIFRKQVLTAIKTVTYIAQSKPTQGDDNWTDIMDSRLLPNATKIFTVDAYDFGDLNGTSVLSFGKSTNGENYICLMGERANAIDGYKEESKLWIFPDEVEAIAEQVVEVSRLVSKNYIRLYAQDKSGSKAPRNNTLFDFYAKAV